MSLLRFGESCEKISEICHCTNAGGNWNRENGGEQGGIFVFGTRKVSVFLCLNVSLTWQNGVVFQGTTYEKAAYFHWNPSGSANNVDWVFRLLVELLRFFFFIYSFLWTQFCKQEYFCLLIVNNCTLLRKSQTHWEGVQYSITNLHLGGVNASLC